MSARLRETAMSNQSVIDLLRGCSLFGSFDQRELRELEKTLQIVDFSPGEFVCREGESGDRMFLIVTGRVRITHAAGGDREQAIALLGPGACIGEMAFLDGGRRSASVVATRSSKLVVVGHESLEAVAERYPASRVKFLKEGVRVLSERLRASNQRYWDLADRSVKTQIHVAESRSRLLSLVSHELRTPLTVIKVAAQAIERGACGHERGFAGKIARESDHLRVLVEDLTALCLLQSGAGAGDGTELDASELVAEVVKELSGLAERSGVVIKANFRNGSSVVLADRGLLRRALYHLIQNAVKFSPPREEVSVDLDVSRAGMTRIQIRDHGDGIDVASLERLKKSFIQNQDPLNRDVEGLGIGLPLACEVVEVLGGRLSAESAPGEGTLVIVELPRMEGRLAVAPAEERSIQHG
jgi:signal transduction histidine kinase